MIRTSDVIDAYPGAASCDTQFRLFGKRRAFHGRIRTVLVYEDNVLVKQVLSERSDGEVLVVEGEGSLHTALIGDLIATIGMKNGWAGVIVNGAVRDSVALDELDFGIKALGTNPRKSAKEGEGGVDTPVTFGGVSFVTGDYLYSDEDGIVVMPEPMEEDA